MESLNPIYERYLDVLDIAFQPIVDIHSGEAFDLLTVSASILCEGEKSPITIADHLRIIID